MGRDDQEEDKSGKVVGMTALIASVIACLVQVESGGRRKPPDGDGGRAVGILQMWPCAVREANRIIGYNEWTLEDRNNPTEARLMCAVTLQWHYGRGVTDPIDLACRWNKPDGKASARYRRKVKQAWTNMHARDTENRSSHKPDVKQ